MPHKPPDTEVFPSLQQLRKAADADSNAQPAPARRGRLGACFACRQSIASHFDTMGRFLGCPEATDDTTFVLVPVLPSGVVQPVPVAPTPSQRRFLRARYHYTGPKDASSLTLSNHRGRVLSTVQNAGRDGAVTRDIVTITKLPYSSATQALAWLQEHKLIEAREDG